MPTCGGIGLILPTRRTRIVEYIDGPNHVSMMQEHTVISISGIVFSSNLTISRISLVYMCKFNEICDKTLNVVMKIFFEHTFGARFFLLFVVYIREIRCCTTLIEGYTFSRTTSYFLRKWQKKSSLNSNLSHLAQKRYTQSFKNEIKTIKNELQFLFLKIKKY